MRENVTELLKRLEETENGGTICLGYNECRKILNLKSELKEVQCLCDDCISWRKGNICSDKAPVTIECDGCCGWVHYTDHCDYNQEYWIACLDKDTGRRYRERREGKRIVIDGIALYTMDNVERGLNECCFTEEKTGFAVPGHKAFTDNGVFIEAAKEVILKNIQRLRPVKELPIKEGEA